VRRQQHAGWRPGRLAIAAHRSLTGGACARPFHSFWFHFSIRAPRAAAHGIRVGAATPLGQGGGVHCRRASRCPVARCRPRIGRFGDRRKVRPDGGSPHGSLAVDRPGCHRSRSPSCTYFHRQWWGMTGWREPHGGPHAACGDLNLVDPVPASRAPPGGVAGEHHARRAGRLATGRRRPLQARATAGCACDAALCRRGWGVPAGRAVPAAPCRQSPPGLLAGISVRCRRGPIKPRSEEARSSRLSRPHRSPASAPRPRRTRLATRVRPVPKPH